jgi:RNA polymerase sigma-70 factor (ECF subfamily)
MSQNSPETHERIKLLTGHQASLRAFIVSLIPGSSEVQDVLQDTNVVIWEKMDNYELGTNFRAWAFTIARNMVQAHLRKAKKYQALSLNPDLIHAINETWFLRPEEATDQKQLALDHCLESLSASERDIVEARYTRGNSLTTHSAQIGRSPESLRVSLFRIRTKLRDCVQRRLVMEKVMNNLEGDTV